MATSTTVRKAKSSKLDRYVHLLGVESDGAVGRRAGVSREAVRIYRTRLGIPAARDGGPIERPTEPTSVVEESEELPPEPGEPTSAEKLPPASGGSSPDGGRKRSAEERLAPFRHRLGHVDDAMIAELAGVTRNVVGTYRRKLRIAAYDGYLWTTGRRPKGEVEAGAGLAPVAVPPAQRQAPTEAVEAATAASKDLKNGPRMTQGTAEPEDQRSGSPKAGRRGPPSKLHAVRELIGVLSDREVAERVGLSTSAVTMHRRKHGILAATKATRSTAGIVAEPPSTAVEVEAPRTVAQPVREVGVATAAAMKTAWKLTLRVEGTEVERFAVTVDVASAARLGEAAGEVVRIERFGEGLA